MHKILSKVSDSKPCINLMALIEFLEEGTVRGRCFLCCGKNFTQGKALALQVHWKNSPSQDEHVSKHFLNTKNVSLLNFGMTASPAVLSM